MVLWELTAITAYFLGLRRTYRLALRLQRRLVGPNHPRIRDFLHKRTRNVFDVAVTVHKNIQQRDLEVGRNLGNRILRWLDRMKPSAEIRPHNVPPMSNSGMPKHLSNSIASHATKKSNMNPIEQEKKGRTLFSTSNIRAKYFPAVPMMMQPGRLPSINGQFRNVSYSTSHVSAASKRESFRGVLRDDIAHWMLQ